MLFPVHFLIGVDTTKPEDQSFERGHKVEPGFFTFKYPGNIFTQGDGQGNSCQVDENNTYIFSIHIDLIFNCV